MKSYIKTLSGISLLSLVFIAELSSNAKGAPTEIELKKKGWAHAVYVVEENTIVVYAFNLSIRKELVRGENINMLLGAEEFKLPEWIRGELRNVVRMVEN